MKRQIFLVCLFYCFFLDWRSTNLLRLFSGNLPAMFVFLFHIFFRNGFSNSLLVRSRTTFLLSQRKFVELYVRTCPAMFFTSSNKNFSLYFSSQLVQHIAWNLFDFSRQVSLFSQSAKSIFRQQLLSKAIQNEQSQC